MNIYTHTVRGSDSIVSRINEDLKKIFQKSFHGYNLNSYIPSEFAKIYDYRTNWLQHVQRMQDHRLTKQIINYKPTGRRCQGRSWKRWNE